MGNTRKRHTKKEARPYTEGELNKLIDSLYHPLFTTDQGYILVDSILHALVEQNPSTTTKKFIRYNLPKLLQKKKQKIVSKR